jgi:hypothetical protein
MGYLRATKAPNEAVERTHTSWPAIITERAAAVRLVGTNESRTQMRQCVLAEEV